MSINFKSSLIYMAELASLPTGHLQRTEGLPAKWTYHHTSWVVCMRCVVVKRKQFDRDLLVQAPLKAMPGGSSQTGLAKTNATPRHKPTLAHALKPRVRSASVTLLKGCKVSRIRVHAPVKLPAGLELPSSEAPRQHALLLNI